MSGNAYPRQVDTDENRQIGTDGNSPEQPTASPEDPTGPTKLAKWLVIYSLLRIGLLLLLAALLSLVMPLILAMLFAVVLALPLSFLLFAGARRQLNGAMASANARRRQERARLQAALDGKTTL